MSSTAGLMMSLLWRLPVIGLWLAGVTVALMRYRRHPRVSILVIAAGVVALVHQGITLVTPMVLSQSGLDPWAYTLVFGTVGTLGALGITTLLLVAAFLDRPPAPPNDLP